MSLLCSSAYYVRTPRRNLVIWLYVFIVSCTKYQIIIVVRIMRTEVVVDYFYGKGLDWCNDLEDPSLRFFYRPPTVLTVRYVVQQIVTSNESAARSCDNRGWGPLHEAAYNGHAHCVRLEKRICTRQLVSKIVDWPVTGKHFSEKRGMGG
jgi:hypothetical protein